MSDNFFDFVDDDLLGQDAKPDASAKTAAQKPAPQDTKVARSRGAQMVRSLNKKTCGFVAIMAVLSAIPIGLNRPEYWLVFSALIALVLLGYMARSYQFDPDRTPRSYGIKTLFGLAAIIPIFAAIQSIPFGAWFPLPFFTGPFDQTNAAPLTLSTISLVPSASLTATLRYCGYILFAFLAFEAVGHQPRAKRFGVWIFWGVVAHALWGLLALRMFGDINIWVQKEAYFGAVTGTFINRNSMATFLAMGACIGIALQLDKSGLPQPRKNRQRPLISPQMIEKMPQWIGLGVILVALVGTQSRLGFVAGITGMFVASVVGLRKLDVAWKYLFGGMAAIAVFGGILLAGSGILERTVFLGNSFSNRFEAYDLTLKLIAERPFLGYGFDNFRVAFEQLQDDPMRITLIWDRAHSTYLTHWVELGLIVGTIPLIICGYVVWKLIDRLRRQDTDYAMPLAALGAMIVAGTHSLFDFSLEMPANVILLITIVCFGMAGRGQAATANAAPDTREIPDT